MCLLLRSLACQSHLDVCSFRCSLWDVGLHNLYRLISLSNFTFSGGHFSTQLKENPKNCTLKANRPQIISHSMYFLHIRWRFSIPISVS
ncbi:hypothetical protein MIMGU_mgv1a017716mg [Erythranthe guttata]|uniref:Uncharacterized protein n=1 Tax=Erythranthe guttata TaxID=4155 RepID=A0A022QZZ2_ERYGU|nr:hypothetical protein MIMGU_mgv1a017716mg [Erythranthe guttata]